MLRVTASVICLASAPYALAAQVSNTQAPSTPVPTSQPAQVPAPSQGTQPPSTEQSKPALSPANPPEGKAIASLSFQRGKAATPGGIGFFVKSAKGTVVGVTSIHLVNIDPPALTRVDWERTEEGFRDIITVASASRSFGVPGKQPMADGNRADYRTDYILFDLDRPPNETTILEFDERELPRGRSQAPNAQPAEAVWVPIASSKSPSGIRWVPGHVELATPTAVSVQLDKHALLFGLSGSPVISQESGKVIGIVSAGGEKRTLFLAPARGIVAALRKADENNERPMLTDIDWKKHGPPPPATARPPTQAPKK